MPCRALAVDRYRKVGAGFAEQLVALAGKGAGCRESVTFDRKAGRLPGKRPLGPLPDR